MMAVDVTTVSLGLNIVAGNRDRKNVKEERKEGRKKPRAIGVLIRMTC